MENSISCLEYSTTPPSEARSARIVLGRGGWHALSCASVAGGKGKWGCSFGSCSTRSLQIYLDLIPKDSLDGEGRNGRDVPHHDGGTH